MAVLVAFNAYFKASLLFFHGFNSVDKDSHIVKIRDNGSGITEENLSKLFEPYFTSKRNGLGLGLAATLNILQAHKGRIEVTSELNKG
ncbi:MAG: PAS domain-containing sensor histidine kinase, partial [Proteobacteria bacterium]